MFYNTFLDSQETIENILAEGTKVWIRVKGTGTDTGEYLGIAPIGKKIMWEDVSIWIIVDGKVIELKCATSELDFYKQLGVIKYI